MVLLGTLGGPGWIPTADIVGIGTALVIGDATYVVDAGDRTAEQYMRANPNGKAPYSEFSGLRGMFFTHLHSDHTIDYFKFLNFGWWHGLGTEGPLQVFGPGRRQTVTRPFAADAVPPVVNPDNPMPGTVDLTQAYLAGSATDINDRVRDNGLPALGDLVKVTDIQIPGYDVAWDALPEMPEMEPFQVFEDDRVRVSATLVNHFPVFPAFAFRFDTDHGSVVISGDTGPSKNLVRLAQGADTLLHEVADDAWLETAYPDNKALRDHMLTAHTGASVLGGLAEQAGVKRLVLHHLIPAEGPIERFQRARSGFSGQFHIGRDLDRFTITV